MSKDQVGRFYCTKSTIFIMVQNNNSSCLIYLIWAGNLLLIVTVCEKSFKVVIESGYYGP